MSVTRLFCCAQANGLLSLIAVSNKFGGCFPTSSDGQLRLESKNATVDADHLEAHKPTDLVGAKTIETTEMPMQSSVSTTRCDMLLLDPKYELAVRFSVPGVMNVGSDGKRVDSIAIANGAVFVAAS